MISQPSVSVSDLVIEPVTPEYKRLRGRAKRFESIGFGAIVITMMAGGVLANIPGETNYRGVAAAVIVVGLVSGLFLMRRGHHALRNLPDAPPNIAMLWGRRAKACPRCEQQERDHSGWCAGCAKLIGAGPALASGHPVLRTIDALNRKDPDLVAALVTREHVDFTVRKAVGPDRLRKLLKGQLSFFKDFSYIPEVLAVDPADPDVVWVRAIQGGKNRLAFSGDWQNHVRRWRVSGDLISETRTYAPLPTAIMRRRVD